MRALRKPRRTIFDSRNGETTNFASLSFVRAGNTDLTLVRARKHGHKKCSTLEYVHAPIVSLRFCETSAKHLLICACTYGGVQSTTEFKPPRRWAITADAVGKCPHHRPVVRNEGQQQGGHVRSIKRMTMTQKRVHGLSSKCGLSLSQKGPSAKAILTKTSSR